MEKKLYGFLNHLKEEGRSKSSVKNYKMDILQFLKFRENTLPEASIHSAFNAYLKFLEEKYSFNSVLRKTSAIKSFIRFSYPFEERVVENTNRKTRALVYLSGFSIALSMILLIVLYSLVSLRFDGERFSPIALGNVAITPVEDEAFESKKGIVLSISAPGIDLETAKDPCKLID